jgi:homoserine kinase type II
MSVYTSISRKELENFLLHFSLGELINFTGIHAGIENTNFAVSTTQGEYILTIFETQTAKELHCIFDLLLYLSQNNFPSPIPQACKKGVFLNTVKGKSAAFFSRLPGCSIDRPSIEQCEEIGIYLAKLHLYGKNFCMKKQDSKKLINWQSVFNKIKLKLAKDDATLLGSELNFQFSCTQLDLPKGIIHADLFRDNVLFYQGKISGIVDFYDASNDFYLFDIAVTANDWCVENNVINQQKLSALLLGYQTIRLLTDNEISHLSIFFRLAALRFWVSRLEHRLNPKSGLLTLEKDPVVFRRLLEYHRSNPIEFFSEYIV